MPTNRAVEGKVDVGLFAFDAAPDIEAQDIVGTLPERVDLRVAQDPGDRGRDLLEREVAYQPPLALRLQRWLVRHPEAVYFGADQPRITAELLLPWSTLGVAPPKPGAARHLETWTMTDTSMRWSPTSVRLPPFFGIRSTSATTG
jgi:hypothetical protein